MATGIDSVVGIGSGSWSMVGISSESRSMAGCGSRSILGIGLVQMIKDIMMEGMDWKGCSGVAPLSSTSLTVQCPNVIPYHAGGDNKEVSVNIINQ